MDEKDIAFELLMGRFSNQDKALLRIEEKLDTVNGRVQAHDRDIAQAKGMAWMGVTVFPALWAVYKFIFGGK